MTKLIFVEVSLPPAVNKNVPPSSDVTPKVDVEQPQDKPIFDDDQVYLEQILDDAGKLCLNLKCFGLFI